MKDFATHYASLSDDDLLRLTSDVSSLLPEAKVALIAEAQRRKLPVDAVDWNAQPNPEPPKVRGWLFLYCFGSVFINPIWILFTVVKQPTLGLIAAPESLLTMGAGLLLWKKNPRGLEWVRWSYLYCLALFCFDLVVVALQFDPFAIGKFIGGVLVGSIPLVLWWLYFRRSKHVCEIYGQNIGGLFSGRGRPRTR